MCLITRLQITVPVGWALNTNNKLTTCLVNRHLHGRVLGYTEGGQEGHGFALKGTVQSGSKPSLVLHCSIGKVKKATPAEFMGSPFISYWSLYTVTSIITFSFSAL